MTAEQGAYDSYDDTNDDQRDEGGPIEHACRHGAYATNDGGVLAENPRKWRYERWASR